MVMYCYIVILLAGTKVSEEDCASCFSVEVSMLSMGSGYVVRVFARWSLRPTGRGPVIGAA